MFLSRSFFSSSLTYIFLLVFACCIFPIEGHTQDCQGKILHNLEIKPYGSQGDVYHYKKGEIIPDVRAHRASFFGKPSYYLSQGVGPLPAKEVELLNCHAVSHPSEGFFDPGYDLIPNDWQKQDTEGENSQIEYRKPIALKK